MRSGKEHSDPELVVEAQREHFDPDVEGGRKEGEGGGGQADVKSNNPDLTGGEKFKTESKADWQEKTNWLEESPEKQKKEHEKNEKIENKYSKPGSSPDFVLLCVSFIPAFGMVFCVCSIFLIV